MNKSNINGINGEQFAVKYLLKKGCDIKALNYRSRYGEIDIIAEDDEYILFVEVKLRNDKSLGLPREAVDSVKQRKIILTSMQYISYVGTSKQPRFDIAEVFVSSKNNKKAKINYLKNAFSAEGYF